MWETEQSSARLNVKGANLLTQSTTECHGGQGLIVLVRMYDARVAQDLAAD